VMTARIFACARRYFMIVTAAFFICLSANVGHARGMPHTRSHERARPVRTTHRLHYTGKCCASPLGCAHRRGFDQNKIVTPVAILWSPNETE
jgi:hypothetical protein